MNRPNPTVNATRFALHTARRAMSRMSTSGAETERSTTANPARTITETPISVTTRAEPHPQLLPCETASSAARSAVARSRLPAQSGRTDSRTSVSGTNNRMPRNRPTATANRNQKTAATDPASTSTPPRSRPTAAPVPAAATSNAIRQAPAPWKPDLGPAQWPAVPTPHPCLAALGRRSALSSIQPGRRQASRRRTRRSRRAEDDVFRICLPGGRPSVPRRPLRAGNRSTAMWPT